MRSVPSEPCQYQAGHLADPLLVQSMPLVTMRHRRVLWMEASGEDGTGKKSNVKVRVEAEMSGSDRVLHPPCRSDGLTEQILDLGVLPLSGRDSFSA